MQVKRSLIQKVKIETVQAKVLLELSPCPKCSGSMSFYLDCPFGEGNLVNPEICAEKCNVNCEALVYCEECDYEEFIDLFPRTGLPLKKGVEDKEVF
ncbi:MAG TPA: hypothetical protein VMX55_13230 [candidate division Zixibacteria bacterium]|nr:hypothetical protein [candidate division Zixibacteria bacterium]